MGNTYQLKDSPNITGTDTGSFIAPHVQKAVLRCGPQDFFRGVRVGLRYIDDWYAGHLSSVSDMLQLYARLIGEGTAAAVKL